MIVMICGVIQIILKVRTGQVELLMSNDGARSYCDNFLWKQCTCLSASNLITLQGTFSIALESKMLDVTIIDVVDVRTLYGSGCL